MNSKPGEESCSTDAAMQKLAKTLKVVSANAELYYLKKTSEVTEAALREVGDSFEEVEALLSEFAEAWHISGNQGYGALCTSGSLDERIDVKLCQNGKLDFAQMKKIVLRLNAVDDVLAALDRISLYMKRYEELCREKLLNELMEHAQIFVSSILNELRRNIESEATRLRNQIERCNLYYQPAMKTKTLWVAVVSLAISSLAFILTILKLLGYI